MLPEEVEKLRQQYTDQYVKVDAGQPELARFRDFVGQVKTINMNGRALVEFDGDNNRGRYDIEVAFLTVVDKPAPKPVEKKAPAAAPKAKPAAAATETAGAPAEKPATG